MPQLVWKERYNVGVRELDAQHKGLLQLVNEFSRLDPNSVSAKEIFTTLHSLVEYAQKHFDTEELLLKKCEYPKLAFQQQEHITFTEDVFKLAQRLEDGDANIHKKIATFIMDWYVSHILGDDQDYKFYFLTKGIM